MHEIFDEYLKAHSLAAMEQSVQETGSGVFLLVLLYIVLKVVGQCFNLSLEVLIWM